MGYKRAKAPKNKYRSIAGYTRSDGTRVAGYLRRKRTDIRRNRTVRG